MAQIVSEPAVEPAKIRLTELGRIASDMVGEIETRYTITVPCFVVMPNRDEAEKAISAYSEKEFMGRKMRVNEAKYTITE